ncbi:DUF3564 family protein [Paraburkholderia sp. CNPSo 3274]|uniref:DUF3564 family protein n=1 Tax=Paraburkholderia sp. CNPSo 3274 TaxID=2940932 RepID=UPI002816183E|nr:DUF3564 family protein [Paraburkholderia sp. CNPSo 3274]
MTIMTDHKASHEQQLENSMRITLHLDTFDRIDPNAYAILWLDNETYRWSREGHAGLQLPEWGMLRVETRSALVCDQHDARPLFILEGLA